MLDVFLLLNDCSEQKGVLWSSDTHHYLLKHLKKYVIWKMEWEFR